MYKDIFHLLYSDACFKFRSDLENAICVSRHLLNKAFHILRRLRFSLIDMISNVGGLDTTCATLIILNLSIVIKTRVNLRWGVLRH
jgi:hypothetical protein